MENPCKSCNLSSGEKAACCGCPDRLKWKREHENQNAFKDCCNCTHSGHDMFDEPCRSCLHGNINDYWELDESSK